MFTELGGEMRLGLGHEANFYGIGLEDQGLELGNEC